MRLELLEFLADETTEIIPSKASARSLRRKARRIERRARRLARKGWYDARGQHHRWDTPTAVMFSFWHMTDLAPSRTDSGYRFTSFGRNAPRGCKLSDWATAYASLGNSR